MKPYFQKSITLFLCVFFISSLSFGRLRYEHYFPQSPQSPQEKSSYRFPDFKSVYLMQENKHAPNMVAIAGESYSGKHLVQVWTYNSENRTLRKEQLPIPVEIKNQDCHPIEIAWSDFPRHQKLKVSYTTIYPNIIKDAFWDMTSKKIFHIENTYKFCLKPSLEFQNPWIKEISVKLKKNMILWLKKELRKKPACIDGITFLQMHCPKCSLSFYPTARKGFSYNCPNCSQEGNVAHVCTPTALCWLNKNAIIFFCSKEQHFTAVTFD